MEGVCVRRERVFVGVVVACPAVSWLSLCGQMACFGCAGLCVPGSLLQLFGPVDHLFLLDLCLVAHDWFVVLLVKGKVVPTCLLEFAWL